MQALYLALGGREGGREGGRGGGQITLTVFFPMTTAVSAKCNQTRSGTCWIAISTRAPAGEVQAFYLGGRREGGGQITLTVSSR